MCCVFLRAGGLILQLNALVFRECLLIILLMVLSSFPFLPSLRLSRYQQFKDFQRRILVATNLFGRGMDIERVNIVFNYDMPEDSDTYLHRVRNEFLSPSPLSYAGKLAVLFAHQAPCEC